jgi:hypothetical protein
VDRWDVLGLVGLVLLGVGLGVLAPWLGMAVAGLVLFAVAVCGAVAAHRQAVREQLAEVAGQKGGER